MREWKPLRAELTLDATILNVGWRASWSDQSRIHGPVGMFGEIAENDYSIQHKTFDAVYDVNAPLPRQQYPSPRSHGAVSGLNTIAQR